MQSSNKRGCGRYTLVYTDSSITVSGMNTNHPQVILKSFQLVRICIWYLSLYHHHHLRTRIIITTAPASSAAARLRWFQRFDARPSPQAAGATGTVTDGGGRVVSLLVGTDAIRARACKARLSLGLRRRHLLTLLRRLVVKDAVVRLGDGRDEGARSGWGGAVRVQDAALDRRLRHDASAVDRRHEPTGEAVVASRVLNEAVVPVVSELD